jgi:hypothetical protein
MASTGWFNRFKNRQQFHNINFTRESAGSNALSAEQFRGILEKNVKESNYSTKQLFNIDETGLF